MAAFRNMSLLLEKENSGDSDDEHYRDIDEVNQVEEANEAEETEGAGEAAEVDDEENIPKKRRKVERKSQWDEDIVNDLLRKI